MVKEEFIKSIWGVNETEVTVYYKNNIVANYKMGVMRVDNGSDYITVYGDGIESIKLEGEIGYDEEMESYVFNNGDLVTYIAA